MLLHRELQDYFSRTPQMLKDYFSGKIGQHDITQSVVEVPLSYGGCFSGNKMTVIDILYFVNAGGTKLAVPAEIKENPRYAARGIRQIWAAQVGLSNMLQEYDIPFGIVISGPLDRPLIISRDFTGKTRNF